MISLNDKVIIAFSDTHGNHRRLQVPEDADIVICAGDAVEDDLKGGEYDDFIAWFGALPAKWKLFVPGNHELSFSRIRYQTVVQKFEAAGIIVLQDAVEECDGVVIGSISRDARIADEDIPDDTDILVTHWPPYGILDNGLGSLNILNFVLKAQPWWHLFGHIHETEGQQFQLAAPFAKIFPFLTPFLGFCRISAEGLVIFAEKLSIWQNSSIKSLVTRRVVYSVSPPLTK